jgi:hypothetical protein
MSWPVFASTVGWTGTVLLLLAYGLVSTRRLSGDGATFQLLNVGGSAGLGVAAVAGGVWSAATLNALWVAIGLVVLARLALRRAAGGPAPRAEADPPAGDAGGHLDAGDRDAGRAQTER